MAAAATRIIRATAAPAPVEPPRSWPKPVPAAYAAAPEPLPGDAIRRLAAAATSSIAPTAQPRVPLAMADVVAVLWTTSLKFDAADPSWPDRDRFVLSDGQDAPLLSALLRLTGHAEVSATPTPPVLPRWQAGAGSVPEYDIQPAIETTCGPSGQGLATAIGMALAERMLAARFGRSLAHHRTWVVAADHDLAGGLSHEAICLAGELRLGRLAVLYDAGDARMTDTAKRLDAANWAVREIDGHDTAAIAAALSFAQRSRRPTLICCRTHHPDSSPAGANAPRPISAELARSWEAAGQRGAAARRAWLKRLAQHPRRLEFERALAGRRPDEWRDALAALKPEGGDRYAGPDPRDTGHRALDALMQAVPELLSCTAGTKPPAPPGHDASRARRVTFGPREHGMAAAMNGLALHGGWLPIGRSRATASDALRPALRLAAMLRQQVIHVLTQDSPHPGDRAASPQPAEHLASLRAIPNVLVFRPADAVETLDCWELALRRHDGPSVIFLSDRPLPPLPRPASDSSPARDNSIDQQTGRGGYVLVEPADRRAATLIASGPEVGIALQAQNALAADGLPVAVVSLPCWETFAAQDAGYRALVLGHAPRVGIEAGCGFGWERWLGRKGRFIGLPGFGTSGMTAAHHSHFGITPDAVIDAVRTLAARS